MRALAVLLVLATGCATTRQVESLQRELAEMRATRTPAPLPRLGGEEASEPVASLGTWVPVQAVKRSLFGQFAPLAAQDSLVVHLAGTETITGAKTFSAAVSMADTLTITKASGNGTIITDGVKHCMKANCSTYVSGDGFGGMSIGGGLGATITSNFSSNGNVAADGIVQGKTGVTIGTTGTAIADSYAAASTIDFASTSDDTRDSSNITVTGAAVGDACEVGVPVAAQVSGASFTCLVTATDTVVVRLSACKAAVDPASGSFTVRTFDP